MNHLSKCKGAGTLDEAESHLFLLGTRLHRCDVAGRKELGSRLQRCLVWWGSWQYCHCGYESSSTLSWLRQITCPCSLERMASSPTHSVGLAETLHSPQLFWVSPASQVRAPSSVPRYQREGPLVITRRHLRPAPRPACTVPSGHNLFSATL